MVKNVCNHHAEPMSMWRDVDRRLRRWFVLVFYDSARDGNDRPRHVDGYPKNRGLGEE
jgi:hypothetical protein